MGIRIIEKYEILYGTWASQTARNIDSVFRFSMRSRQYLIGSPNFVQVTLTSQMSHAASLLESKVNHHELKVTVEPWPISVPMNYRWSLVKIVILNLNKMTSYICKLNYLCSFSFKFHFWRPDSNVSVNCADIIKYLFFIL